MGCPVYNCSASLKAAFWGRCSASSLVIDSVCTMYADDSQVYVSTPANNAVVRLTATSTTGWRPTDCVWTQPRLGSCGWALASSWTRSRSETCSCCRPRWQSSIQHATSASSSTAGCTCCRCPSHCLLYQLWQLRPVCICGQDTSAGLRIQSIGLLQRTAVWRVWRADASSTIGPESRRATCNRRVAPWPHHAHYTTASLDAHASTTDLQDRRPGVPVSDWAGTGVSGRRLSAYFRR